MRAPQKCSLILPRQAGDRFLLLVFGTVLAGFFALMTFAMQERTATGWLASLLHHIAVETMFTFAIFSLLAVVWALFTPRWIESAISQGFWKVLSVIAVVLLATVFTILYYTV